MSDDPKQYPRAQISIGPGELRDATDAEIQITSTSKNVHTLRQNGAGFIDGNQECTFTVNTIIPETGPERPWLKDYIKNRKKIQVRLKLPGTEPLSVIGKVTGATIRATLEEGTQFNITGTGTIQA